MDLTDEVCSGLGIALNEATLVSVAVDATTWTAYVTLAVLTLPVEGESPVDNRVLLVLQSVGRIAASLRLGDWNDRQAPVEAFPLNRLPEVVASFGQLPVYGWDFFDVPEADGFSEWEDRLSLDHLGGAGMLTHTLWLFQDGLDGVGNSRILDLQFWFDTLEIRGPDGTQIPLDKFVASGRQWWDALHTGDGRTSGAGIIPLA
jgi:hypothetical protein